MATVKQTKKSAAGGKRGATVGAVRKRKAAKRSAGSGAWSHETLAGPKHIVIGDASIYNANRWGGPGGYASSKAFWYYLGKFYDQQTLGAAESGVQARVEAGADRGEPERADKPAEGGQQAGGVPDAGGGDAAGKVLAYEGDDWGRYHYRGLHWASRIGIVGAARNNYAIGYADGRTVKDRETARRTCTRAGAALFIGAAAGVVLLAIAQRILGG